MKKHPAVYILIFGLWFGLLAVTFQPLMTAVFAARQEDFFVLALVLISTACVGYFWLNGVKDIVYTLFYYVRRRHVGKVPEQGLWQRTRGNEPRVDLVYCTYNDFNEASLHASMFQEYKNYKVVILDDSTQQDYKDAVDAFAEKWDIFVLRRKDHAGFKAGNLNNYLQRAKYDFFVILDSDEIIPRHFIRRSLDYFAADPTTGIVQANHIATRNRNTFMSLFAIGVDSHWPTYQAVKNYHGFLSLLGHGAMVSRDCYFAAGGFPHLVAEDLCFSIEARNKGYFTAFAPDILCEEEYPVSYLAFKKRHSKWTQGNMEFIKRYTGRILRSNMTWFEKMDIFLFTYNLPLTAFFAFYIVINVMLLPFLDFEVVYPMWLLIPTVVFLIAPMLNDIVFYRRKINPFRLVWYLGHSLLLYGSMFFISLKSSLKAVFGKSVFLVTPKDHVRLSWGSAIIANKGEIMFASVLLALSVVFNQSPLPVLLIVLPSLASIYLALLANRSR